MPGEFLSMDAEPTLGPVLDALLRPALGYALDPWPQSLWERVEALARAANQVPAVWLTRTLVSPDPAVVTQLVAAATITHTGFFRHGEHFTRLESELRARRGRAVRILCAGCSRGEEAYSLALTAERAGIAFQIDAIDINADAIAHAERGRYDARAARNLPEVDPLRGWSAPPRIRERIRFERCSLTDGLSARRNGPYDYVFCRNVLIYFSPEAAFEMVQALLAHIATTGALVLAPTEALAMVPAGLQRSVPMGWLVRERAAKKLMAAPSPIASDAATSAEHPNALAIDRGAPLEDVLTPVLQGLTDEADLLVWLEARPHDAVAWFLLGEKLVQRAELAQASVAFAQVATHAEQATLVDPDTLRAAAQRRLQGVRSSSSSRSTQAGNSYTRLPKRK
jgi:chemotaxis protein methyltransferase CheR